MSLLSPRNFSEKQTIVYPEGIKQIYGTLSKTGYLGFAYFNEGNFF